MLTNSAKIISEVRASLLNLGQTTFHQCPLQVEDAVLTVNVDTGLKTSGTQTK